MFGISDIFAIPYFPGIPDFLGILGIPDILCIPDTLMLCENQNALKSESSLSLTHLVTDKMDPRDAYASKNQLPFTAQNYSILPPVPVTPRKQQPT